MTINQLKAVLYERTAAYWNGATVVWGATDKVKPYSPVVVLRLGTVSRAAQPVTQNINGIVFSAYPSEVTLQVDLYTRGNIVDVDVDDDSYAENTATSDLIDFINFLDSPASVEWSDFNDISISIENGVQDLSEVINDSQWQYRAMAELVVSFTQWVAEHSGVIGESCIILDENGLPTGIDTSKWKQTASGGGTQELANASTGFFEEAIIEQEENSNG